MLKRIPIIMLIIAVVLVGFTFLLNTCDSGSGEPAQNSAKYQILADNRQYYTDKYVQGVDKYGEYVTLQGYWAFDGKYWTYQKTDLYLSKRAYKSVVGIDRANSSTAFVLK